MGLLLQDSFLKKLADEGEERCDSCREISARLGFVVQWKTQVSLEAVRSTGQQGGELKTLNQGRPRQGRQLSAATAPGGIQAAGGVVLAHTVFVICRI